MSCLLAIQGLMHGVPCNCFRLVGSSFIDLAIQASQGEVI